MGHHAGMNGMGMIDGVGNSYYPMSGVMSGHGLVDHLHSSYPPLSSSQPKLKKQKKEKKEKKKRKQKAPKLNPDGTKLRRRRSLRKFVDLVKLVQKRMRSLLNYLIPPFQELEFIHWSKELKKLKNGCQKQEEEFGTKRLSTDVVKDWQMHVHDSREDLLRVCPRRNFRFKSWMVL
jgi:hypothetical protein